MDQDFGESQIEAVRGPHLITIPKDVLDQIGKEHTEEIKRLRQQVEDLALVARGAAYRIKDTKKSQRFLAMIDKAVGGK